MEKKCSYVKGIRCNQTFGGQGAALHLKREKLLHKHLYLSQMANHSTFQAQNTPFPMFSAYN